MSLLSMVKSGAIVARKWAVRNAPRIAVIGGSIAVVTGGVIACKKTLECEAILDSLNEKLENIQITKDAAETGIVEYTEMSRKKDLVASYCCAAGEFVKLYALPIVLVSAGFAAIFSGFGIISKRLGGAIGAIGAIETQFADYRNRVKAVYGEEVDNKILTNSLSLDSDKANIVNIDDDTGEEKTQEWDTVNLANHETSFSDIFDYTSPGWDGNYIFNDNTIVSAIDRLSRDLRFRQRRFVSVNDFRKELYRIEDISTLTSDPDELKRLYAGNYYGWSNDDQGISVDVIPFIRVWNGENDSQFPMELIVNMGDDEQVQAFKNAYIRDERSVGYYLKYNVDRDSNGNAVELLTKSFGY